ncbi:MAG: putative quinol monooxygenase [Alphaproteobacteria bacterium]|nr:putative quinol monooxygenase [Alphaproteobacteria bacterium]
MTQLTVIARIKAQPDSAATVEQELGKLVPPTQKEKGCINYDLHRDRSDPSLFFFHENWESEADLDAHLQSAHISACMAVIGPLLEYAEVYRTDRIS